MKDASTTVAEREEPARAACASPAEPSGRPGWVLGIVGACVAAWSSMCGIGGGLFAVPLLHYVCRLPMKEAVGTSLGLVLATSASATLTEALLPDSRLHWGIVGLLIAGAFVGTKLGFLASQRIPARPLKAMFALLLLIVAARLVFASGEADRTVGVPELDLARGLGIVAVGFAAGFVAPLLGIGGVIAVPGMYVGVHGFGYLAARACALAMATFNGGRSLMMHHAAGGVSVSRAAWMASGAVVGAFVGVRLVHVPGVVHVARHMMAFTLLVVAARFGVDLRPRSRG